MYKDGDSSNDDDSSFVGSDESEWDSSDEDGLEQLSWSGIFSHKTYIYRLGHNGGREQN